jgi:hypothetical protein
MYIYNIYIYTHTHTCMHVYVYTHVCIHKFGIRCNPAVDSALPTSRQSRFVGRSSHPRATGVFSLTFPIVRSRTQW